jgi:hypothetical protein
MKLQILPELRFFVLCACEKARFQNIALRFETPGDHGRVIALATSKDLKK